MRPHLLRRSAQIGFALLLFLALVSHAWAGGGPFSWAPLPLPGSLSDTGWRIGALAPAPFLVLLVWLASRWQDPSARWSWGPTAVTLPLAAFSLLALTRLTLSSAHYTIMLTLCWVIYLFLVNNRDWQRRRFPWLLALVLVVQGTVGVLQFWSQQEVGLSWLGEPVLDVAQEGTSVVQRGSDHWLRAYGLNSHPNQLGLVLMALCLLVYARQTAVSGWSRWLFWSALALGIAGLLVSLSRSAWLALAVGGLVYALPDRSTGEARPPQGVYRRALPLLLLAAGVVVFAALYGDVVIGRFLALDNPLESRSLWERQRDATLALHLIGDQPWQGVGLGRYTSAATTLNQNAGTVHNVPLLIGAELGVLGLIIWLVWWGAPLAAYGRSPQNRPATAVWLGLITIALVQPEPHLFLPKGAILWGIAAAQWQQTP